MYPALLRKCFATNVLPPEISQYIFNYDCRTSSSMNRAFFQGCKIFIIVNCGSPNQIDPRYGAPYPICQGVENTRTDVLTLITVNAHILSSSMLFYVMGSPIDCHITNRIHTEESLTQRFEKLLGLSTSSRESRSLPIFVLSLTATAADCRKGTRGRGKMCSVTNCQEMKMSINL